MIVARTILLFFLASSFSSADNSDDDDSLIKVKILSRSVRFMVEGKISNLVLATDKNALIINEMNNEAFKDGSRIIFSINRGIGQAVIGGMLLKNKFKIKILNRENTGYIKVSVQNNERRYPLPVEIECGGGVINFYTWASRNRYCIDSAIAEYGRISPVNREAVLSLAHLIRARVLLNKKAPRHRDADFCDLTHCQVYRGIMNGDDIFKDTWNIDINGCQDTLYFHASCGGETFDKSIFGNDGRKASCSNAGMRDWMYRDGVRLCAGPGSNWSREIGMVELCTILFNRGSSGKCRDLAVEYNRQARMVNVRRGNYSVSYPSETFRLKVNRVRGWNFIKSNNYSISENTKNGEKVLIFKGRGNGHGVGMCQEGAVNLARMGYSRYEILEHYYPALTFGALDRNDQLNPYLSYCIFDLASGEALETNPGVRFLERRIPPGSVFKLFVILYIAKERQDIFNEYTFICRGNNALDENLPERCWNRNGHGRLDIRGALAISCNLYFASLYNRISYKNFKKFFSDLCGCMGISYALPEMVNEKQWSKMLAGLDFSMELRVRDYMRLVQTLAISSSQTASVSCLDLPENQKKAIFLALGATFTSGTASGKIKPYGSPINYIELDSRLNGSDQKELPCEIWGKTATVLEGTNRPVSYGLFVGGCADRGIITLLRKGNGNLSARWARVLMRRQTGSRGE